jgi:hypothetical protein
MRNNKAREGLFELLRTKSKHIPIVKEVCTELLRDVGGETKNSVIEILEHPLIKDHYLKYFNSYNKKRKVKSLLYFRSIKTLPDAQESRAVSLLDHRLHYLAHASALVILASAKDNLHESVLIKMCKRSEDCKYTFVELLWEYWDNEFISKQEKLICFQVLLGSEDTSVEMKALLVRIISSFNEKEFSIYFHDILKFLIELDLQKKHYPFLAALINALGKFDFKTAEEEIIKATSVDNKLVKIAAIRALIKFKTTRAIQELEIIYSASKGYLKKEISYLIEHDPNLSKLILRSEATVKNIKDTGREFNHDF